MRRRYDLWVSLETDTGVVRTRRQFTARPCNAMRMALAMKRAETDAHPFAYGFVLAWRENGLVAKVLERQRR